MKIVNTTILIRLSHSTFYYNLYIYLRTYPALRDANYKRIQKVVRATYEIKRYIQKKYLYNLKLSFMQ